MTAAGLLFRGRLVDPPGLHVIAPALAGGPSWVALNPGDCRPRPALWIRQALVHSTGGRWPQPILPGAGPGGEAARIADIWHTDPVHSAAQLLVDSAGTIACLCDLVTTMAYHAEGSNPWSVGIEMFQRADGGIYQATIDATARLCIVLCDELGIPAQFHAGPYLNAPLARMESGTGRMRHNLGGPDCVGIFGHRQNTSERGRGDPGDAIFAALEQAGAEPLDFAAGQDLERGRARQRWINLRGTASIDGSLGVLKVDGIVGPKSLAEARRLGFRRWRDVPAVA